VAQPLSLISLTVMMFFLGPFSEEFGWRGFALDRLLARWSALPSSLILGVGLVVLAVIVTLVASPNTLSRQSGR
jgi:membrane protease YdiL (CAAX protease family)